MGLEPDMDIVNELLTLMGPDALELTINKDHLTKENISAASSSFGGYNGTDCDADVSSYTSRS